MSESEWPVLPVNEPSGWKNDYEKAIFQGRVDEAKAMFRDPIEDRRRKEDKDFEREKQDWDREKEQWAAEYALHKAVHDARLELAKGSVERGRAAAEFVRNAAAAIVTLYTGVLALAFSIDKDAQAGPLPVEGIIPAFFLGLATVLAAAYVAFLNQKRDMRAPASHSVLRILQERRLNAFVDWASALALDNARALHGAVFSLGFGVVFLPAAFLNWPLVSVGRGAVSWLAILLVAAGLLVTALLPLRTCPKPGSTSLSEQTSESD